MGFDETKITSFQGICTVILREHRVEHGCHREVLSDYCGEAPGYWEKVEAGKAKLTFDALLRVCRPLDLLPSELMLTAERYRWALESRGWSVAMTDVGNADALVGRAQKYWESPGYRFNGASMSFMRPILRSAEYIDNGYFRGWTSLAHVFQFADDEEFRKVQLDEERHRPFEGPLQPYVPGRF